MSELGHFQPTDQSCLPVHVRFAPKADLRLRATGTRRIEVGRTLTIIVTDSDPGGQGQITGALCSVFEVL
jgi:hypothetical protein